MHEVCVFMAGQVQQQHRNNNLNRRFILFLLSVLGSVSACFLVLFYFFYDALKSSLERAMLRRDIGGLHEIVEALGAQDGISEVVILNTQGEVRFASEKQRLGMSAKEKVMRVCPACFRADVPEQPVSRFLVTESGQELLRTVFPVRNKPQCIQCHDNPATHPVNGLLVVDYDALPIRQKSRFHILLLAAAGSIVLLFVTLSAWWFMRRNVLEPVHKLDQASNALARGKLDTRVTVCGNDEMSGLANTFNQMARSICHARNVLISREQFLQGVIDALPDGVRVIDPFYQIVVANRRYAQLAGVPSPEALRQQYCYKVSFQRDTPCPPSLRTCPLHILKNEPRTGRYIENLCREDGSVSVTEVYAAPLPIGDESDDSGGKGGDKEFLVVEAVRDQEAIVQYSHEQKLSALGELAAGVAHEIHNPLASVQIALDAGRQILKEGDNRSVAELGDYLTLVDEQVAACLEVTHRLMKLGTLSGNYAELVEVNKVCREVLSLLSFEREQHGIKIELDFQQDRLRILAADSDFRMIVLNLVQNAFHAMTDGGTLTLQTRREHGLIVVCVKDTGIGIAEEVLPYIFEPFFSRRNDQPGSGLGLAIVHSLVNQHGGTVNVVKHELGNTVFRLKFPDADQAKEEKR